MRNKVLALLSIWLMIYTNAIPASAVENGVDALNDPNAVSINGASGFLYAPRIVLTTAHNHINTETRVWLVGMPGETMTAISEKVSAQGENILIPKTYSDRTAFSGGNVFSRTDDFAVIILDKPIPMRNTVKIATQEQIENFKRNHSSAVMVGYGLQNLEMRQKSNNGMNPVDVTPKKINTTFLTDNEAQSIIKNSLPSNGIFTMDAYFAQTPSISSICDNDSGAGWFVEQDKVRYYVGAQSTGWGAPNCGNTGNWSTQGAFTAVSAAYKFTNLISEAEQYVKDHPTVVFKSSNPLTSGRVTITCVKGKTVKKFSGTNPKCPAGYKTR
jgi:hypothetical protein